MTCVLYAVLSVVCLLVLQHFSWAPVQVRISEALCVAALFSKSAAPKLAAGCAVANLIGMLIFGLWPAGLLDVVFGSLATFLGALWCYRFRENRAKALFGFVLTNALIVAAYLPFVAQGSGFYTIPFTDISFDGNYLAMYAFSIVTVGIGEAISVFALGWPLSKLLFRKYSE
ncbi:MAG: QueT transporter family protein [Coriobacteriales bacterium]|nr:QueT transporter family protein [Coriobacteriales bacterium]